MASPSSTVPRARIPWPAGLSLGGRFAVALTTVLATLSLAGLAWYGQSARLEARTALDERIAQHQQYVQQSMKVALQSRDIGLLNAALDALQGHPDLVRVRLDAKGIAPALTRERAGAAGEQISRVQTLRQGAESLGDVSVDYSTARADEVVRSRLRTLFAFSVALVLAAGATALLVARGVARPIADWTRAATAVAEGGDVPPMTPHGPPELMALGASFERMRSFSRERIGAVARQDQLLSGVIAERGQIQKERDRLIGLIESTSDLVGTCDPNLNVTYLNRAGRETTWVGDRPVDAISISTLHPQWAGRLIQEQGLPTAMRVGTWSGETAVLDAQGREVPVSQVIACHRDADGQVMYLSTIMRDITDRKRAEAALQRSEARLRQALQASGTGVFEHDHDTDKLYRSPEMRQQIGAGTDQPISFDVLVESIHPDDRQAFVLAARRAHDPSGDGSFDIVFRHIRPDGGTRWTSCRSLTTFEGEGSARRPVRTTGAMVDITERREAQAALERSEERLRQAVRLTRSGIFDHDHHTDTIYWSPEQRANYGFSAAEPVTSQAFMDCVHPEDFAIIGQAFERAHDPTGNGDFDVVHRIIRRDGAIRWLQTRSITLFEGTGEERHAIRTVGAVVDITERQMAEEALRRSESRLTYAVRASNTGIYDHELASDVMYGSPELRTLFGWTADEPITIAHTVAALLAEDHERMGAAIARSHDPAGDGLFEIEYRIRRRDGALRWLRSCGQTLFAGDGADRHPVRTVGGVVDITERREAEEALRRSEGRLTQAVQASNTGIFEHDLGSGSFYSSPEHRIMNGWSAEEPITFSDIVAATLAEDRDRLGAAIMRARDPAGDGVLDIEHRIRRRDGVVRWLSVRAQTFFAGEGAERRPVRTIGGVIDITQRREDEEALRRSEGRLARAVLAAKTGIFDHDHVSGEIYWSPEYRAMHGRSADETITIASIIESTLVEDRERLAAAVRHSHDPAGDGHYEIEFRVRRSDGTVRCLRSNAQSQFAGVGAERRAVRTTGGVVDITERREAEEALRRSELNYRTLFETMNQGVVTQDYTGAIVDANPAAQEILGLSLEQMQGRTSLDPRWRTVLPDGRELPGDEHPAMVSLRTNRPVKDVTMGVVRPDEAELRWILVSAIPRVRPGETAPYEVTATFTDITELERAGEQIRRLNAELEQRVLDRTAQLEATVHELESFSYSVSHDLRAPLRGIDGFSQAILEDFGDRLDDTGRDYLHRVRANTQRMGQLIDDLLKLSRVTRAPLTPHLVDLGRLAQRALHQLEERHPDQRPLTTVQPGPMVYGDPGLLLVALENLLGNAWKYSSRKPDAHIEYGHLTRDGETVCFVRDNGVGFDMKYVSKLFGAFQRLHHQKEFEGTGIGLATVKRIVNRHSGRVWAEAEPGKGATFCFTIGRLHETVAAKPAGVAGAEAS